MNLSMRWLKDYVDYTGTPKEFSDAMTSKGFAKKVREGRRFWLGIKRAAPFEYRSMI